MCRNMEHGRMCTYRPNDGVCWYKPEIIITGQDYDIYALAVQECMGKIVDIIVAINNIRDLFTNIIGGDYYFSEMKIGNTTKELGFHGFIALFVFIKSIYIQSGFIRLEEIRGTETSLGIDLLLTRVSNKV